MKFFQEMVWLRLGAGAIPCRFKMLPTVWSDTTYPTLASAPTIRSYPHALFSRAIRTMSASNSFEILGRPGYSRFLEPSNFWAINFRYQARIVSGLAMLAISLSALRPRRLPISARVARSSSFSRSFSGSLVLNIQFSAVGYSICSSNS